VTKIAFDSDRTHPCAECGDPILPPWPKIILGNGLQIKVFHPDCYSAFSLERSSVQTSHPVPTGST